MNRRHFLKSSLGASTLALMSPGTALSGVAQKQPVEAQAEQTVLRVVRRTIEVKGRPASVFGIHQPNGTPGLVLPAGSTFDVSLQNETDEPTIVHWHGLTPPWTIDGVAGSPLPLIPAKTERGFRFPVGAAGTHWMHAHTLQEQALLAAPLIVRSVDDEHRDEQEVVVLLHDFSFSTPEELFERLKHSKATDATGMPGMAPMAGMADGGAMPMDLNDIDYDAFLANDRTLDDPEVVPVELGGRVRIRIINGATATVFTLDLGELEGTLIAVDGQNIRPVKGRRFPLAMGQRIDVRLELPREARPFPILALREGAREQTGIILRSPGAAVAKLPNLSVEDAPVVDLGLEAKLRALAPLKSRSADNAFDMALTGGMQGYSWGLETPKPILARRRDRVEIVMRNTSMMAHPMHLHGHHFQVMAIDGQRFSGAVRDTVHIPPRRSVTIAVDANNPGQWAFHCHHLYHMAAGMMSRFAYQT